MEILLIIVIIVLIFTLFYMIYSVRKLAGGTIQADESIFGLTIASVSGTPVIIYDHKLKKLNDILKSIQRNGSVSDPENYKEVMSILIRPMEKGFEFDYVKEIYRSLVKNNCEIITYVSPGEIYEDVKDSSYFLHKIRDNKRYLIIDVYRNVPGENVYFNEKIGDYELIGFVSRAVFKGNSYYSTSKVSDGYDVYFGINRKIHVNNWKDLMKLSNFYSQDIVLLYGKIDGEIEEYDIV